STFSYCVRLRDLDLSCVILNADISPLLENVAGNLEIFSLEETSWVQKYFHRMNKLRKLNVRRAMFNLDRLYELPSCLESIEMSGARKFPPELFNEFLVTHPNIRQLGLCPLPVWNALTLEYISNLPVLDDLQLGEFYSLFQITLVNCEGISDETMYSLAASQNVISTIAVQGCCGVTSFSKGVAALALLKHILNLRELDVSHNRNIDDMAILSIHNGLEMKRRQKAMKARKETETNIAKCCTKGTTNTTPK
uniref:Uncharacterized protein n=1 Tax=Parascaris equorum TaxID=6256 RepID=A0A914RJZ4_PAREQ